MKKQTTINKLKILLLVCAVLVTMLGTAIPAYAAGGTITVNYTPDSQGVTETTFYLYKVGSFGRLEDGTSVLVLDPKFGDVNVNFSKDDENWQKNYLDAANKIYNNITTMSDKPEPIDTKTWKKSEGLKTVSFNRVADNGLYLIAGSQCKVGDYYWWPVPVLVQVLNGDETFTVIDSKMNSTPVTYTHTVTKQWAGEHDKARPTSVKVDIVYGDLEKVYKSYRVELSGSNGWSYTWQTKENGAEKTYIDANGVAETFEVKDEKGNPVYCTWSVKEVAEGNLAKYFVSTVEGPKPVPEDADPEDVIKDNYTITNTFSMDELVITKTMEDYFQAAEGAATPVVFDIKGYIGAEEVYHNQQGISFSRPGQGTLTISNLPLGLDKIEVKELYSPNYTPDKATKVYTEEAGKTSDFGYVAKEDGTGRKYSVSFTNTWNGGTGYNTGIVNKYEKGDGGNYSIVDRQGLKPEKQ